MSVGRSAGVAFAGLWLFYGAAGAATGSGPLQARFDYEAPRARGCPAARQVQEAIARGLGDDPFRTDAGLHVLVAIREAGDGSRGLVADVALSDGAGLTLGQQRIRSQAGDCRVLSSATTLAIRMILESDGETLPAPTPLPAVAPAAAPRSPVALATGALATTSLATPSPRADLTWVFSLGPLGALGASVGPNLGVMAGAELRWRSLSLGVDLRADLPDSAALPFGASEQISLLAAGLVPCRRFGPLAGCALLFLGREQANGLGLERGQALNTLYAAAGARAQIELWVSRAFGLSLAADLWVPFARTQTYASTQPEWSTPPVAGVLWLAAESRIF